MSQLQKVRAFSKIIIVFGIAILLLLAGFQSIPMLSASSAQTINQAGLQRTRVELIAKSALILANRPESEHIQALSDLQVVLPLFEQEQADLSHNPYGDVQVMLQSIRGSYLAIDTAARSILAHKDRVEIEQIQIILSKNQDYRAGINQIVTALQVHADDQLHQLFSIEIILDALLLILALFLLYVLDRVLKRFEQSADTSA